MHWDSTPGLRGLTSERVVGCECPTLLQGCLCSVGWEVRFPVTCQDSRSNLHELGERGHLGPQVVFSDLEKTFFSCRLIYFFKVLWPYFPALDPRLPQPVNADLS